MQVIILAAGKSSRFNTTASKLSFTLCGQALIVYPVRLFSQLGLPITFVLGHQKEQLQTLINSSITIYNPSSTITYAEQHEPQGTGHALLCTRHLWQNENILVINGDMPLVTQDIIQQLITQHITTQATITFATAHVTNPALTGYGRVIEHNQSVAIVEARDFTSIPEQYPLINAGIYCFKRRFLEQVLPSLRASTSGEIYITDLIAQANITGELIKTIQVPFSAIQGINTLEELAQAEQIQCSTLIKYWMSQGVRFIAPQTVHIDLGVTLGKGTVIGAGVQLRGQTRIGTNCVIDAYTIIDTSIIHDTSYIHAHSVISHAILESYVQVGPFAHIHRHSSVGPHAQVGNFVQVSKSTLGAHTKVKHLAYIGQTTTGTEVNIGAGVITCNYNGVTKHDTTIQDHAFIGSNSVLIAPVTIEQRAYVAAGSVITSNVPADALAIARSVQVIKQEYAQKLRAKYKQESTGV